MSKAVEERILAAEEELAAAREELKKLAVADMDNWSPVKGNRYAVLSEDHTTVKIRRLCHEPAENTWGQAKIENNLLWHPDLADELKRAAEIKRRFNKIVKANGGAGYKQGEYNWFVAIDNDYHISSNYHKTTRSLPHSMYMTKAAATEIVQYFTPGDLKLMYKFL